jgi:hypothetical protein
MWVPATFSEEYEYGGPARDANARQDPGTEHETIICEAEYANYRRFETSVRIR